ncbi:MAG: LytTR family DNA-binding domain-containing protein [Bacteroidia bacterium]
MHCIIADDEPLARKGMENFIRDVPFLDLVATCSDALEVIQITSEKKIDLLFLDIHMPKMSGITLLKNTVNLPITIITTAYPNYAVETYELAVIDYLVKPIPFERFIKAVTKAKDYFELLQQSKIGNDIINEFCFVKCDKSYEKIMYKNILYIEAMLNYAIIHTTDKKYITYVTLKAIEDQLPGSQFIKINKSFIVNVQKIQKIEGNEIILGVNHLQIGRAFKDTVMQLLLNGKLLKR